MRKNTYTLLVVMLFACMSILGENATLQKNDTLSADEFNGLIHKQFSNLITGSASNSIGGFASLDIEKTKVNFAPNYIFRNGHILAVKAGGGISDGLFEVFNHSELNTNVSLDLQYNFINRLQSRTLAFGVADYHALADARTKIMEKFSRDSLYIVMRQEFNLLTLEKEKLKKNKSQLEKNRVDLKKQTGEADDVFRTRCDSLDYEIADLNLKIKSIDRKLDEFSDPVWKEKSLIKLRNARIEDLKEVGVGNLTTKGFQFGWFSFGYKLGNDAFKTLDPSQSSSDQVKKENVISHGFRAQYSFYRWSAGNFKTFFISAALTYDYKSNYEDLTSVEITDQTVYNTADGDRTAAKKYSAYVGNLNKGLSVWGSSVDAYYFLLKNNSLGLHVFPTVKISGKQDPITDVGVGLIFPFKDKNKEKSIVNAEVYCCFSDVFKTTETTYKLFERNKIGLKFAFPIDFNLHKAN